MELLQRYRVKDDRTLEVLNNKDIINNIEIHVYHDDGFKYKYKLSNEMVQELNISDDEVYLKNCIIATHYEHYLKKELYTEHKAFRRNKKIDNLLDEV